MRHPSMQGGLTMRRRAKRSALYGAVNVDTDMVTADA
jgi:hypothetical protein